MHPQQIRIRHFINKVSVRKEIPLLSSIKNKDMIIFMGCLAAKREDNNFIKRKSSNNKNQSIKNKEHKVDNLERNNFKRLKICCFISSRRNLIINWRRNRLKSKDKEMSLFKPNSTEIN
jgi:hypothetical protein